MRLTLFAMLLLCVLPAFADEAARGMWWYQYPEEVKPLPKREPVPTSTKSQEIEPKDGEAPMSVAWLRKKYPIMMDIATDDPSDDNVSALLYMQRVMLDKSQRLSEKAKFVVAKDPYLDENNRVPFSAFGKDAFNGAEFAGKEASLKHLSSKVGGLLFFFDSKCDFCKSQVLVMQAFAKKYSFNVRNVSMDGKGLPGIETFEKDNGHAQMLKLKIFPTIVFAAPPKTYLVLSQGMMAEDQLKDRIITAAIQSQLLPQNLEKLVNPYDAGVLTSADLKHGASDDPKKIIEYLQNKLKDRY